MNAPQAYVAVGLIVLLAIAVLLFLRGRTLPSQRVTPLAGIAFAFVLAGIVFGDPRLLGYSLMGVGVILAVIDIVRRSGRT